jgi:hypothetical protein
MTGKEEQESGLVATILSFGNLMDTSASGPLPPAYAQLTLASNNHHDWTLARVNCPSGSSCTEAKVANWQAGRLLEDAATMSFITDKERIKEKLPLIFVPKKAKKTTFKPEARNVLAATYAMKNKDHTATIYTCWYRVARLIRRDMLRCTLAVFYPLPPPPFPVPSSAWSAVPRFILLHQTDKNAAVNLLWYKSYTKKGKKIETELRQEGLPATILRAATSTKADTIADGSSVAECNEYQTAPVPKKVKKRVCCCMLSPALRGLVPLIMQPPPSHTSILAGV